MKTHPSTLKKYNIERVKYLECVKHSMSAIINPNDLLSLFMSGVSLNRLDHTQPINIIYTGVAGTGKTYRLLQIAKQYTEQLPTTSTHELLSQLLYELSWREVVCLVFLDLKTQQQDLLKVPEIVSHEFFVAKAAQNERNKNLNNTAWSVLQTHSPAHSKTVSHKNRAAQPYFDKDDSGSWYLLRNSMALLDDLAQQLADFRQAQRDNQALSTQRYSMVSFHQAYGYEEFVEGIRPVVVPSSSAHSAPNPSVAQSQQMHYDIQDGAFLRLCQRAANDPDHRYAMLVDEINRANVSRVFGELLSLIEPDKRAGQAQAMQVNLAYSGRAFSVPANVDIYATMNTQDHSLAPLDMALRRRFRFVDCPPQPELLAVIQISGQTSTSSAAHDSLEEHNRDKNDSLETIDLAKVLTGLNQRITQTLGQDAQLGHAFLLSVQTLAQLRAALVEQIIPQLAQAAGGQVALLQYLFNDDAQPASAQFIQDSQGVSPQQAGKADRQLSPNSNHHVPNAFLGAAINVGNYRINPDLIAQTGEFARADVYQRLY